MVSFHSHWPAAAFWFWFTWFLLLFFISYCFFLRFSFFISHWRSLLTSRFLAHFHLPPLPTAGTVFGLLHNHLKCCTLWAWHQLPPESSATWLRVGKCNCQWLTNVNGELKAVNDRTFEVRAAHWHGSYLLYIIYINLIDLKVFWCIIYAFKLKRNSHEWAIFYWKFNKMYLALWVNWIWENFWVEFIYLFI